MLYQFCSWVQNVLFICALLHKNLGISFNNTLYFIILYHVVLHLSPKLSFLVGMQVVVIAYRFNGFVQNSESHY